MTATIKSHLPRFAIAILALALIALGNRGCKSTAPSTAASNGAALNQLTFASPDEAVKTLVAALRAHDSTQLQLIFGPGSDDLLFSGDPVADQQTQEHFLQAYDEKHQVTSNADGSVAAPWRQGRTTGPCRSR